jgi:transmembrane sensor
MLRTFLRKRFSGIRGGDTTAPDSAIDAAVLHDRAHLAAQDPDTEARWRVLQAHMGTGDPVATTTGTFAPRRGRALTLAFSLGAVAVIIVCVLLLRRPIAPREYQTGIAQQSTVMLSDSSEVLLNHTSLLTVLANAPGLARRASLKGEAYFRVKKTGSPFEVQTGVGVVRVLGTEFNLRVRQQIMDVAVVRGKVCVSATAGGRDSTVYLEAGQRTTVTLGGYPGPAHPFPFSIAYPGWLYGKFVFEQSTIAGACEEIQSQFGVDIAVVNPDLGAKTITGVIEGRTIEEALRTLCALAHISYRHENDRYTLY